jgi:hypothetical protein
LSIGLKKKQELREVSILQIDCVYTSFSARMSSGTNPSISQQICCSTKPSADPIGYGTLSGGIRAGFKRTLIQNSIVTALMHSGMVMHYGKFGSELSFVRRGRQFWESER